MKTLETLESQIKGFIDSLDDVESSISNMRYELEAMLDEIEDSREQKVVTVSDVDNNLANLLSQFVNKHVSQYPLATWQYRIETELHKLRINEIKSNEEKA